MSYPPLEAAWARFNRAAKDRRRLHENIELCLAKRPYGVDAECDPKSGWWVARTHIVEEPPPVLGGLVGSVAH
jgi:hypothetical protein